MFYEEELRRLRIWLHWQTTKKPSEMQRRWSGETVENWRWNWTVFGNASSTQVEVVYVSEFLQMHAFYCVLILCAVSYRGSHSRISVEIWL